MRQDAAALTVKNISANKEPHFVAEVAFDAANTDLYYFTSREDTALLGGALSIKGVLINISGTSQSVTPEKALATIGTLSFEVVDKADTVTGLQYSKLVLGKSLRGMRVRVYIGYDGLDWVDYSLVGTQIVEDVSYTDGAYQFRCADIQREARKDIFDLVSTNLSQTVEIGDTTVNVYNTSEFVALEHSNSFSDAPGQTVYYFKIEDEIIRATDVTATTFTGCTRGVLNTKEARHIVDVDASADRRTEVTEYVYLELPAPKLAYAILTGKLIGQTTELPPGWHLGISEIYVKQSDFSGIGPDLFDTTDDSNGVVLRFEGLKKQDGKTFVEKELLLLMGAFSPVYGDGSLGLRRMVSVLSKSGYVYQLDESNVVSNSGLLHDMKSMHNYIEINWNWLDSKEKYTRRNALIDPNSIAAHGITTPLQFKFRGLNGSRHSTETLGDRFDAFRDRYTGPPLRITVTCLHSTNILEVGDTVRLKHEHIKDYNTGLSLDRTFEVQNTSIDWDSGKVSFRLFGSSRAANEIAQTVSDNVVPDAFYTSEGINLATHVGAGYDYTTDYENIGGVGHIKTTSAITGGVNLKDAGASIYYHDGDLIIDAGVIFSFAENVQLRVKGHLTINGEINGVGAGLIGAAYRPQDREYNVSYSAPSKRSNHTLGIAGFIGSTQSGGGWYNPVSSGTVIYSYQGWTAVGQHDVAPKLTFEVKSGVVEGIPTDIRGTSGSTGAVTESQFRGPYYPWATLAGGPGGNGGAGLLIIARGVSFGASGKIDTSGGDGQSGDHFGGGPSTSVFTTNDPDYWAGSGAGGAPGAVYFVIDGVSSAAPVLDKVVACYGKTPVNGNQFPSAAHNWNAGGGVSPPQPWYSFYSGVGCPTSDLSGYNGAARIAFVIGAEVPTEDTDAGVIAPPTALSLASGTNILLENNDGTIATRIKASWVASNDPRVVGYEVQFKKSTDTVWLPHPDVIGEVSTFIAYVQDSVNYDVRVRAADNARNTSVWVTQLNYPVVGKTAAPSNVTGFAVLQNGASIVLKWNQVPDVDLAGYEIRYGPENDNDFAGATPLTSVTRGTSITTTDVPAGTWKYYIVAVDTTGNKSTVPATKVASFNTDYDIIHTQNEHPQWNGTLTNLVKHWTGVLVPESQNLTSADNWDVFDKFVANPYPDCYYEGAEIDTGLDGAVRVSSTIISNLAPGDTTGVADPKLEIDYRLNAGAYDGFESWGVGIANARFVKPRIHVNTSVGIPIIKQFKPIVDVQERKEKATGISVPDTGLNVTFSKPFYKAPFVTVQVQSATVLNVTRTNVTTTGFDIYVFDSGGTAVAGTVDWEAIGA